jgi:hypothetical protein
MSEGDPISDIRNWLISFSSRVTNLTHTFPSIRREVMFPVYFERIAKYSS